MNRKDFIKLVNPLLMMSPISTLQSLHSLTSSFAEREKLMPAFFIGHGSPMNGIEDNIFSKRWKELAKEIPDPQAVLVISAHWYTRGTKITAMDFPKTIHDFGGFPQELFDVQYPAPGNPILAKETAQIIKSAHVEQDHEWGLDHGTWTIVRHMYPDAKIPVLQLSIDYTQPAAFHYELAKELSVLRKKGVLLIGSGNMVHNLGMVSWENLSKPEYGYDWALEMNHQFKEMISKSEHEQLIHYEKMGAKAKLAIPTPEHYLPLIYTLGLRQQTEEPLFFNDKAVGGSLTMTSVRFG